MYLVHYQYTLTVAAKCYKLNTNTIYFCYNIHQQQPQKMEYLKSHKQKILIIVHKYQNE